MTVTVSLRIAQRFTPMRRPMDAPIIVTKKPVRTDASSQGVILQIQMTIRITAMLVYIIVAPLLFARLPSCPSSIRIQVSLNT